MARGKQLITLEVTSNTKAVGDLYPARRIVPTVDTVSGAVSMSEDVNVLVFDINNNILSTETLYHARKARSQGLITGKAIYMVNHCCAVRDDEGPYWASCEEFINVEHTVELATFVCYYPGIQSVTNPRVAFTISPDGAGRLVGYGEWTTTGWFGSRTEYFRVTAACIPLETEEGIFPLRWELEYLGQSFNGGPLDTLNYRMFYSQTMLSVGSIFGGLASGETEETGLCHGTYYWTPQSGASFIVPYYLTVD